MKRRRIVSCSAGSLQSFFALPLNSRSWVAALCGGSPQLEVESDKETGSPQRLNSGKIAVVGWVVLGLVTGASFAREEQRQLQHRKVLSGMQQHLHQGGNSDLSVRAGLGARLMLNGWREAGGFPRRISEGKKVGEFFGSVSSGRLAC